MQRRMKELDRNVGDPNADIPDIEMPLGIIPCGEFNVSQLAVNNGQNRSIRLIHQVCKNCLGVKLKSYS